MHISASSLFVKVLMWMRIFTKCEDKKKEDLLMRKLIFIMVFAMTMQSNIALASDNKPQTCESREIPRSREKNVTVGISTVFRRDI